MKNQPIVWTLLLQLLPVVAIEAQEAGGSRLRVFLDCGGDAVCDQREFRTEIQFVDWVLEATSADVHLIMSAQDTGGGAQQVIDFIGRNALEAVSDRLTVTVADTNTREERLRAVTALLKAGLTRFLAHHGRAEDVSIEAARAEVDGPAIIGSDVWNYWVFRVGADADAQGETQQTESSLSASVSANRTTLDWRLDFEAELDFNREEFELNDGRIFTNDTDDWSVGGLIVRSVAGHWSSGGFFSVSTSTRLNQRLAATSAAALEYSFFPYEEANRRALVAHYQVGVARYRYDERTIFDKLQETVGERRLALAYSSRQTWGDASVSVDYSTLLRDWNKNRLSFDMFTGIRIFRGLELELSGEYERIRDQIYLSAEDLSDEEIIAERRELATGYQYEVRVGLSYRFGSILNNFVNNRFPGNLVGL
jgi:hypothetical protein